MTVRELFNQVRKHRYMVDALTDDLNRVRRDAYSLKAVRIGDKVQSSNKQDLEQVVERIASYEDKLTCAIDELMTLKARASEIIKLEPDLCARAVLYRRYILAESWDCIAQDVGYSRAWSIGIAEKSINRLGKLHI